MLNIFAAESVGLPLLFLIPLFLIIHAKILDVPAHKQFNVKLPFKVTQGHVFWDQWTSDEELNNTM